MASDMKAAVTARYKALMDAYNAGDFKAVSDCYTEDCQSVGPKKPIGIGREAVQKICKDFVDSGAKTLAYDIQHLHGSPDGELAYLIARVKMTKPDGTDLDPGNNMITMKKVDGKYYVCVDMFN